MIVFLMGLGAIVLLKYYIYFMKSLKLLWFVSLVLFTGYVVYDFIGNGFNGTLLASGLALVFSGVGVLNK